MRIDNRRITLVTRGLRTPDRDWDDSVSASTRIVFVNTFTVLKYALAGSLSDMRLDIERVVIDNAASPAEFLEMLSSLPGDFSGDAMLIRSDGSAFLSASGRGDGRVIYSMTATDVRFYLETHDLVTGRVALRRTA
ncbi:MAG TPA: hypothetical protein VFN10_10395 [Thermoanaerobaculia bacterium]|nr:hypothetical protein [Thermoanaerobaculia bacterium]